MSWILLIIWFIACQYILDPWEEGWVLRYKKSKRECLGKFAKFLIRLAVLAVVGIVLLYIYFATK
jgi:hypothetical protein